jgi:putative two-component system response regulator
MKKPTEGRLLIVDDDPVIRKVLRIGLEKSGFRVHAVESGRDALAYIRRNREYPDCMLLDIRMPEMSGIEVLDRVKMDYPLISIIMLTAQTDLETAVDTMKRGAFDYIVKPIRKPQLVETIKKALQFRQIQLDNERLARENLEYQKSLEMKVEERTRKLIEAYKQLKESNLETVKVLAETIEAKDPYTRGHCNRVRILSSELAALIGMNRENIEVLEYGSLLHDIGKIGISETLLHKVEHLTLEERETFQLHTTIGENILNTVEFFKPCLFIIRSHHERFDGTGYPDGKGGDEIGVSARIVAIADAFDAMTSTRPYRKALTTEVALNELMTGSGTQFDPALIDTFIKHDIYKVLPIIGEKMSSVS